MNTITFSDQAKGWTSFWSYVPDWMIGMNSSFYTWKDGNLYKHDSNSTRNNFYGVDYPSKITTIFNQESTLVKLHKTINIDGTHPWDTTVTTDLSSGFIDQDFYSKVEGEWFSYIRREDDGSYDLYSLSVQGIGQLAIYNSLQLIFNFNIGSMISDGDIVYAVSGGSLVLLGAVASHGLDTIDLVSIGGYTPSPGDQIVYAKNSQAESHGARGYFMEVTLEKTHPDEVEIFAIKTNVFKSNQ